MAELRNVVRKKKNGGRGASSRGFVRKIGFFSLQVTIKTNLLAERLFQTFCVGGATQNLTKVLPDGLETKNVTGVIPCLMSQRFSSVLGA